LALASCARGAEGVAVEPEVRVADGVGLLRDLSPVNGVEDGVDGFGDEGAPVGLGTIGFATAHSASRFLRLAA
jgi:hypothetical protein